MAPADVVDVLNELIQVSEDGAQGFRVCGEDADDLQLRTFFANRARSCAAAADELRDLVRSYGGEPARAGGWGGALHRRWIDVRALISGRGDGAVLEECLRGEEVALESYRRALGSSLPPDAHDIVERQYRGVWRNWEQVRNLHAQYREL